MRILFSALFLQLLALTQQSGFCVAEGNEGDIDWKLQEQSNLRDDESVKKLFGHRHVTTLKDLYYHGASNQIEQFLECVKGYEGFELTPNWAGLEPPGAKLLFVGNSHLGQYKEALVLGMNDSRVVEETHNVFYNGSYESLGRCPCILDEKEGRLKSKFCDPVDLRALNVQGRIVCNGRNVSENFDRDKQLSFICEDMLSKVVMEDGSTIALIKNNPYLIFPTGIRDAVMNLGLALADFDVIVANEGNNVASIVTSRCRESMERIPEWGQLVQKALTSYENGINDLAIAPHNLIETLMHSGFSGTLLYTSNGKWMQIPKDEHQRWNAAVELLRPAFNVLPFEVMSKTAHPLHTRCGANAHVGAHHTIPGPPNVGAHLVRLKVEQIVCQARAHIACEQLTAAVSE